MGEAGDGRLPLLAFPPLAVWPSRMARGTGSAGNAGMRFRLTFLRFDVLEDE